jgi:SAM-dependent methyltransferase
VRHAPTPAGRGSRDATLPRAAVRYWNAVASGSESEARDAILCGFRSWKRFDAAGLEDAAHLVLPFVDDHSVVLDVGCGIGRILKWVAPACRRAIGLDVSYQMLRRARSYLRDLENVELRRVPSSLALPVADRSADFIYFYHVSEHLEREQCFAILREISRCLKLRGAALVGFSVLDYPANRHEFVHWATAGDREGVRSRFYSESEAITLLGMAGLFPQIRLYVPGELVWVVTKQATATQGAMPLVQLASRSWRLTHGTMRRDKNGSPSP